MTSLTDAFRRFFPRAVGDGQIRPQELAAPASLPKMNRIGPVLFAIGMAGLGALSIIYRSFALVWQPIPESFPHRDGRWEIADGNRLDQR